MEENLEKKADAQRLRLLIEALPARERQLVLLRYGLAGQPPLTQLETAQLLGISRSYVSRLESPRAGPAAPELEKLKFPAFARQFGPSERSLRAWESGEKVIQQGVLERGVFRD